MNFKVCLNVRVIDRETHFKSGDPIFLEVSQKKAAFGRRNKCRRRKRKASLLKMIDCKIEMVGIQAEYAAKQLCIQPPTCCQHGGIVKDATATEAWNKPVYEGTGTTLAGTKGLRGCQSPCDVGAIPA